MRFDFGTIRVAADNFFDANKLGRGGFGEVYWVGKYPDMKWITLILWSCVELLYFYIIYDHAYRLGCLMDKR